MDEGSDEIGSDSGMVAWAWASGNGDEARCRLSISVVKEGGRGNASDSAECENPGRRTRRGDEAMKGLRLHTTRNAHPLSRIT